MHIRRLWNRLKIDAVWKCLHRTVFARKSKLWRYMRALRYLLNSPFWIEQFKPRAKRVTLFKSIRFRRLHDGWPFWKRSTFGSVFGNSIVWCRVNRDVTASKTTRLQMKRVNVWTLHKSLAIIPSRSRPTMWARYPKIKTVRAVSEWKQRTKDSLLLAHVDVITSNLVISCRRYAEYRKNMC